ncbi:hypothetical protein M514_03941 [Trichuris suis]|uniref:Uncharacterized protein n=1 Tax=Trichuris suis TaxID=68888 RepID=A0A085MDK4_9BILA|nr:hypothetical protein M513_03941 [Trichuris suis]KFD65903.1 hypothetical protein M514_03941 [Trichuris suis]
MVDVTNGQKTESEKAERLKRRKVELAKLEIQKVIFANGRNVEWSNYRKSERKFGTSKACVMVEQDERKHIARSLCITLVVCRVT